MCVYVRAYVCVCKNRNKNRHPQYTMCANFQSKWIILTFSAQICPKMDLGFKILKTNVGIRISILEIPHLSFSGKTDNFDFSDKICAKMDFWVGIS